MFVAVTVVECCGHLYVGNTSRLHNVASGNRGSRNMCGRGRLTLTRRLAVTEVARLAVTQVGAGRVDTSTVLVTRTSPTLVNV